MATQKERSNSNGSQGITPSPPLASGLQTEEGTATRPSATSTETPANQPADFDQSMMEKFFSFMSFYEQHQQSAPAESHNSNNNGATPMSLDGSSYARGNQQQQPTFAPYERGSISFMPHPQPSPGQEKSLDALQVQSQFAHVLKMLTSRPFDGKDFFTWSFEFELMMEGAQILGFFDGSLPYSTNGTQYKKQQYTYQSMMAYTILLRNITPTQQQNIRSYRGYGNSAELAYNHEEHDTRQTAHTVSGQLLGLIDARKVVVELEFTGPLLQERGLYIGKAVLKNNVFVLDFVPDLGTADSDAIVNFTNWTHPPDLDPDFSPEGFWYSHTIPEAERTRALATIQTTSTAAETTSAAAETTSAVAKPLTATAGTSTPIAGPSTTPLLIDDTPPTPAQQLHPAPQEVHRSANFTANFYSNSDMYQRSPGHRADESTWHARMGHPSNTVLNNTIRTHSY
ncbi:unnamed protein product [Closterium sp. NIES-54]